MKLTVSADGEVREFNTDDPYFTQYDDYATYEIDDEGCSANVCEIKKPQVGHNGGCSCLRRAPLPDRIALRRWLRENHSPVVGRRKL